MIAANQWYNIAKTDTIGTRTGIRIDFGTKYALFTVSVDYGNSVITAVESNISKEETKLSVRIRQNNNAWYVDVRMSVAQDTTLKAALYENTGGWEAVAPNTSIVGNTICIINDLTSHIIPSGGESLFERINVGTAENPFYAVVPKKYNGVDVGIISNTFMSMAGFGLPDDVPAVVPTLRDLNDVQITEPAAGDVLTYDDVLGTWVNGPGGLNEDALSKYLQDKKYITDTLLTNTLKGYLTVEVYNAGVKEINKKITAVEERIKWFYYDEENNAIHTSCNFISDGTMSMAGVGGSDVTPAVPNITIKLGEVPYDSVNGVVSLPAYPSVGLDENALESYLTTNQYAKKSDIPSLEGYARASDLNTLRTDFDNLYNLLNTDVTGVINTWYEVVDFLDEYSGSEDLATILSSMNTDIARNANNIASNANAITAVSNRVQKFEDVIGIDSNGDVYIKGTRNFYTAGGTIGMAGLGSGGSGGGGTAGLGSVTVRVNGQDYITDASGIVTIPDYLTLSGGTITTQNYGAFEVKRNYVNYDSVIKYSNVDDGLLGYIGIGGSATANAPKAPYYSPNGDTVYALLHAGNYSSYALPKSGGTISNSNWGSQLTLNGDGTDAGLKFTNSGNFRGLLYTNNDGRLGWYDMSGADHTIIHSGNIGSQSVNYANSAGNAEKVGGVPVTIGDNKPWGTIPAITPYGYMDVGKHFEFHYDNTTGSDYSTILMCTGNYSNIVYLPSASGTLALLTDNVASADYAKKSGALDALARDLPANTRGSLDNSYALYTGGWAYSNLGYASTYGTYIDLSGYSTWYHRLAFNTTGEIEHFMGINTTTLSKVGSLAYTTSNVASATKATQDGNGNIIASTYLPLSGGILSDYWSGGTQIRRKDSNNGYVNLAFSNSDGTIMGGLGFAGIDDPIFITSAGDAYISLIHSGNIGSQSVANSLRLDGVSISRVIHGDNTSRTTHSSYEWNSYYPSGFYVNNRCFTIHQSYNEGNVAGITLMCYDGTNEPLYLLTQDGGGGGSFIQLARVTDNVASATKLQTARTIWGKSFDGTGNVSGNLILGYNKIYLSQDNENYYLGWNSNTELEYTNYYGHIFKTGGSERMRIATNGNVLIGTTTDNGAKLQVNGGVTTYGSINMQNIGAIQNALAISRHDNGTGYYVGSRNAGLDVADGGCLVYAYGNTPISLYTNGSERVRISGSGNVIINSNTRFDSGLIFMNDLSEGIYIHGSGINFHNSNNAWVASCLSFDYYGNTTLYHNLTVTGDITSEGTMAMAKLASSSDRKLKANIAEVSAEQSMGIVRQLRPTTWNWKKDGKKSYGFIAQEVEPIVPEMVVNMEHLHLEYNQLHAFEIGAIQHLDSEVDVLKRELKRTQKQLKIATRKMNSLELQLNKYRRAAGCQ